MHIAFFNPQGNFDNQDSYWTEHPDFGGQLVYVKELALALNRQGHDTIIFTRRMEDPDWPEFIKPEEHYAGTGVKIVRIDFGGKQFLSKEALWPYLREFVEGVRQWYKRADKMPDIVTTHYGDGGVSGAMFQDLTGVPFTFTAHSLGAQKLDKLIKNTTNFSELSKQYKFTTRLAAERMAMNQALVRVVSTEQERDQQYTHALYGDLFNAETKKEFAVVPPGVNRNIFAENTDDHDAVVKQMFQRVIKRDIDQSRQSLPITIASSRLDPKKNVTGLVEAYAENMDWRNKSNLMLAVRGLDHPTDDLHTLKPEEQEQLKTIFNIMDSHNLQGKVAFINLESQRALAAAYRIVANNKGVFCLTSLYEPFGLATIEAMSCGLPVVVTENGGGSEILREDEETFGMLVNPEDPSSIAKGALQMLLNQEKWTYYRNQGLSRVKTTYTWDAAATGYTTSIAKTKNKLNVNENSVSMGINTKELIYFMDPSHKNRHLLHQMEEKINSYIKEIY